MDDWFHSMIEPSRICLRCDSFVAVKVAAESGIGLALLPDILGDTSDKLVQLQALSPELNTGLWLLTHPDLVRSARIHAFVEHISEAFEAI